MVSSVTPDSYDDCRCGFGYEVLVPDEAGGDVDVDVLFVLLCPEK